jgi:hypothetical protein
LLLIRGSFSEIAAVTHPDGRIAGIYRKKFTDSPAQTVAVLNAVEIQPGVSPLGCDPPMGAWRIAVLEPTVRIGD